VAQSLLRLALRPRNRVKMVLGAAVCCSRFLIGVGRTEWSRSPLPPNRTGGSPASGSPVGGFYLQED
jgi:hypothetical protein